MRRTSGIRGACLALAALFIVAANAWQYDPDVMANPNMGLQPPMLPNFGMDPLGVFPQPMQMAPPPQMRMMMPDPTMDFDPELSPLQPNSIGAPRFMQQPAVTSVVVRRNRMGQFSAVPGEEDVPAGQPCRAGEPGCGTAQVIETATTTTATPIDEDKNKEQREEEERERRERKEKEEKRKREREEEEEKKKKEKEERDEKRKKEREEKEERDKKEREEREERHRKEREEREERQRERREKRREEDEQDKKDDEDDDDKPRRKGGKKSKKDDDEDEEKDGKKKKCSKCSKCNKKKGDKDDKSGGKDEASLEGPDGKTIHVVVSTKGGDDKDEDKEKGDCDKKCDEESSCDKEEEEAMKEDPLVTEKKKEYAKLTQAIKKDEEEFSKEADWLTKALSLIGELKQKTHNVQMHLNDMHKDMSLMERKRQRAAAELEEAEKKKGEESTLHKLEKELDLLMSASTAANEKINMFASRKAQYLAKIGEVRNMLQSIKLSHMMANPSAFQSMAESFRAPPPPPEIGQPNGGQEDDKMEVIPQFR